MSLKLILLSVVIVSAAWVSASGSLAQTELISPVPAQAQPQVKAQSTKDDNRLPVGLASWSAGLALAGLGTTLVVRRKLKNKACGEIEFIDPEV